MGKKFLAHGIGICVLALGLVACGEDGKNGVDGAPGEQGAAGESCTAKPVETGVEISCGGVVVDTLTNGVGSKGDTGTGCSVGDPSTDKDGNTVVNVTCGETSKTLTIAKGDPGEAGIGCKAEDKGDGKVVVTCGDGESKTEQTLYKAVCGSESYDPTEAFCFEGNTYSCDNKPYNPAEQYCLTLKDRDGVEKMTVEELLIDNRDKNNAQAYKTVKICDNNNENCQTWMAENLNYGGVQSWCGGSGTTEGDCSKYGRLYTWKVAMDKADCGDYAYCNNSYEGSQGVCPQGWHLPSDADWNSLIDNVGGISTADQKLKSTSGWKDNGNGTDTFGFAVLPAGFRSDGGKVFDEGFGARFWSSTEYDTGNEYDYRAYDWDFYYGVIGEGVGNESFPKNRALSVRCVKDL